MRDPTMSDCRDYSSVVSKVHRFNDETKCWPSIWNQFHIQDDFELRYQDKWELISDALNNRICSRGIYGKELKNVNYTTDDFYNSKKVELLTLNYLNVAKAFSF